MARSCFGLGSGNAQKQNAMIRAEGFVLGFIRATLRPDTRAKILCPRKPFEVFGTDCLKVPQDVTLVVESEGQNKDFELASGGGGVVWRRSIQRLRMPKDQVNYTESNTFSYQ